MEEKKVPYHVGIIMDGNRRWAISNGLKKSEGHKEGYNTIKEISKYIYKEGVKVLSIFAFSTDNFKRDDDEITSLMNLFIKGFNELKKTYNEDNIKLIFSGRREPLRKDVLKSMDEIVESTKNNTGGILNICINYGGQAEIVDTTKKLIKKVQNKELSVEDITEETFRENLYQDLPPLDLIIRTSGELRLSGFMLYNSTYAELYFSELNFPDFKFEKVKEVLEEYKNRNRKFGGSN